MHLKLEIFLALSLALASSRRPLACTTFYRGHPSERVLGRNLDWYSSHGVLLVNPRNVQKSSMILTGALNPVTWISKHGSLTFNQTGREFPFGGINESGLVIESLTWSGTEYPKQQSYPSINESQWIQYGLDQAATVEELSTLVQRLYVSKHFAPIHYFACDASSNCAIFEYKNKQLMIYKDSSLGVVSLANNSYADSLKYLQKFKGFGGRTPIPASGESDSLSRFVKAANFTRYGTVNSSSIDPYFTELSTMKTSRTQWQVAYDLKNQKIHFRTATSKKIKEVSLLNKFDYSCKNPPTYFNLDENVAGEINQFFQPFTNEVNTQMVEKASYLPATLRKAIILQSLKNNVCME